jgi:hypothetical protein
VSPCAASQRLSRANEYKYDTAVHGD